MTPANTEQALREARKHIAENAPCDGLLEKIDAVLSPSPAPQDRREAASLAAFHAMYGADVSPHYNPEGFDFCSQIADAILSTLDTPDADIVRSDWFNGDVDADGNDLVTIRADELAKLQQAARSAHDTLIELNPANYTHEDVEEANNAAVEAILILADALGETHGKTPEWWEQRRAMLTAAHPKPEPVETQPVAGGRE